MAPPLRHKPYKAKDPEASRLKLIATLQAYRQRIEEGRNFGNYEIDKQWRGKPYFSRHHPEVQKLAWEYFSSLCTKHKERIATNPRLIGVLVGLSTKLAKMKLGLIDGGKGIMTIRTMFSLKTQLGIHDGSSTRRQNAASTTNV